MENNSMEAGPTLPFPARFTIRTQSKKKLAISTKNVVRLHIIAVDLLQFQQRRSSSIIRQDVQGVHCNTHSAIAPILFQLYTALV
mmetsp:Transcript_13943/g.20370  ORF Transcript_13943/g.20370 Transcript_13943/m.20370 type:complete len:85 (-) Transcript_13943:172-426(-)